MFYEIELLTNARNGRFAVVWIASTMGLKHVKKEVKDVNIVSTADEVLQFIMSTSFNPKRRFSLYLSSHLILGICRIFHRQSEILLNDFYSMYTFSMNPLVRDDKMLTIQRKKDAALVEEPPKRKRAISRPKRTRPNAATIREIPQDVEPEFQPQQIVQIEEVSYVEPDAAAIAAITLQEAPPQPSYKDDEDDDSYEALQLSKKRKLSSGKVLEIEHPVTVIIPPEAEIQNLGPQLEIMEIEEIEIPQPPQRNPEPPCERMETEPIPEEKKQTVDKQPTKKGAAKKKGPKKTSPYMEALKKLIIVAKPEKKKKKKSKEIKTIPEQFPPRKLKFNFPADEILAEFAREDIFREDFLAKFRLSKENVSDAARLTEGSASVEKDSLKSRTSPRKLSENYSDPLGTGISPGLQKTRVSAQPSLPSIAEGNAEVAEASKDPEKEIVTVVYEEATVLPDQQQLNVAIESNPEEISVINEGNDLKLPDFKSSGLTNDPTSERLQVFKKHLALKVFPQVGNNMVDIHKLLPPATTKRLTAAAAIYDLIELTRKGYVKLHKDENLSLIGFSRGERLIKLVYAE